MLPSFAGTLLLIVSAFVVSAQETVQNGGFDYALGLSPWVDDGQKLNLWSFLDQNSDTGGSAANTAAFSASLTQSIDNLIGGQAYTLSVDILFARADGTYYSATGYGEAIISLGDTLEDTYTDSDSGTGQWFTVTATFIPPETGSYDLVLGGNNYYHFTFFDNVSLTPNNPATGRARSRARARARARAAQEERRANRARVL